MPLDPITLPAWAQVTDTVASLMRARLGLKDGADGYDETFSEQTGISRALVEREIVGVYPEVRAAIGLLGMPSERPADDADPPRPLMQTLWDLMGSAVAYGAAAAVELSTMPEQVQVDRGPYQAYLAEYERRLKALGTFADMVREEDGNDGDPATPADGLGASLYNPFPYCYASEARW